MTKSQFACAAPLLGLLLSACSGDGASATTIGGGGGSGGASSAGGMGGASSATGGGSAMGSAVGSGGGGTSGSGGSGGGSEDHDASAADSGAKGDVESEATNLDADALAERADDASDSQVAYDPCPPKGTPCVALPLGDSITQGAGSPAPGGGYRVELFHQAVSHGQSVKFVGSAASGPTEVDMVPFPRAHEGHGGVTHPQKPPLPAGGATHPT